MTRSTRLAANAAAIAVVTYGLLFGATTQVKAIRAASPFGDDPWDVVVSYGAIFLALVVGATAVRSLSHRGPHLDPRVAARIRTGAAMAVLTIGLTLVSDVAALVLVPLPDPLARTDGRLALIDGLLVVSIATTLVATYLLARAHSGANAAADPALLVGNEPDIIDDLLGLAREGARVVPPVRSIVDRLTAVAERFLVGSPVSPRRHRLAFGVAGALAAGLAYDVWHAIVEGPWGSMFALGLFTVLISGGVLAVYLATVGPLRLVRPAGPA
jgi:hypothetical protein